jgi:hypothetical protein
MKTYIRNALTGVSAFALTLFMTNGFFIGQARAQTASTTPSQQSQSEFKHDVEKGVNEVKNDKDAQHNQQEIDTADDEHAGDEHGEVNEVDGEHNQNEIDDEIELEVDHENSASGHSSHHESGTASSTETHTSNND